MKQQASNEPSIADFRETFEQAVLAPDFSWDIVGFVNPDGVVYPLGTDTKVISSTFEALCGPVIETFAERFGYVVEGADQTVYPDFTLSPKGHGRKGRIAIDVKTTYRRFTAGGKVRPFRYTLGSFTSFLRDPKAAKNIKYPYEEYSSHWVIGFIYTRQDGVDSKPLMAVSAPAEARCPYSDVEYFIQEKYRIVGLTPASGNTANIGSFPATSVEQLAEGNGPFSAVGKEVCDRYWRFYAKTARDRPYSDVGTFLRWEEGR